MMARESLASLGRKIAQLWSAGETPLFKAPAGMLAAGDNEEVRRRKVEILSHLRSTALGSGAIVSVVRNGPLLRALSQQRHWLVDQLGTNAACNLPRTVRLEGVQGAARDSSKRTYRRPRRSSGESCRHYNMELALQRPFERPAIAKLEIDSVGWLLSNRAAGAKIERGSI